MARPTDREKVRKFPLRQSSCSHIPPRPPPSLSPCPSNLSILQRTHPLKHGATATNRRQRRSCKEHEQPREVEKTQKEKGAEVLEDGTAGGKVLPGLHRCDRNTWPTGISSDSRRPPPVLLSSRVPYFSTAPCICLTCPPPRSCSPGAAISRPHRPWRPTWGRTIGKRRERTKPTDYTET